MIKIMIVDDEYLFREALKSSIQWKELGYEVCCEAENGYDALDKLLKYKPEVALVDINMPVMDGIDFVAEIYGKGYDVRTIIISGYGEFEYARKTFKLGVEDYLLKPIDDDEFKKVLAKVKKDIEQDEVVKLKNSESYETSDEYILEKDKNPDNIIAKVYSYISDNISRYDLNIDKIAGHVFLSYKYLCYLFKSKTGKTINEYITDMRMKKARGLMEQGNLSIMLIAGKTGYADVNYFGKCFKKHFGVTPSEYIGSVPNKRNSR